MPTRTLEAEAEAEAASDPYAGWRVWCPVRRKLVPYSTYVPQDPEPKLHRATTRGGEPITVKECRGCLQILAVSEFYPRSTNTPQRLKSRCKYCLSLDAAEYANTAAGKAARAAARKKFETSMRLQTIRAAALEQHKQKLLAAVPALAALIPPAYKDAKQG